MPITQDRLIRLIDITKRTLEWADAIKTQSNRHLTEIYNIVSTLEGEESKDKINYGLGVIRNKVHVIESIMQDYPLSANDTLTLGAEMGHFNATSRHNSVARDRMRLSRTRKAEEAIANTYTSLPAIPRNLTPEQQAELDEFNALPSVRPQNPAPKPEQPRVVTGKPNISQEDRNLYYGGSDAEPTEGDNLDINLPAFLTKKPETEH